MALILSREELGYCGSGCCRFAPDVKFTVPLFRIERYSGTDFGLVPHLPTAPIPVDDWLALQDATSFTVGVKQRSMGDDLNQIKRSRRP